MGVDHREPRAPFSDVRKPIGGFLQWSQRADFDDDGTNVSGGATPGDEQPARKPQEPGYQMTWALHCRPLWPSERVRFLELRRKPPANGPPTTAWTRVNRGAPVGAAGSGGQQVGDLLDGLAEPESLAGPVIELVGDGLEMRPVVDGQVGALGEVLA